ncbi:hypothetical protein B6U70_00485 [Euryarchaeota archaeon ex4484_162]|nr:MAG: hypothetical protein B6U70_00485 [Euryarchaeota archaeon ex4484_162]
MKIRNILAVSMIALLLTSVAVQAINISSVKKEKTTDSFLSKIPAEYRVLLEQNTELKEQLENMIKNGLDVYGMFSYGRGFSIFFPPLLPVFKTLRLDAKSFFLLGYYISYKKGVTAIFNLATGEVEKTTGQHKVMFAGPAFGFVVVKDIRVVGEKNLFLFSLNPPTIIQS